MSSADTGSKEITTKEKKESEEQAVPGERPSGDVVVDVAIDPEMIGRQEGPATGEGENEPVGSTEVVGSKKKEQEKREKIEEQIAQVTSGVAKRNAENLAQSETTVTSIPGKGKGNTDNNSEHISQNQGGGGTAGSAAASPPSVQPPSPPPVNISRRSTRPFRVDVNGHYHPGSYGDMLNPAYVRYVNVNLGGLRFMSGLRTLIYIGEDEPPRRIMAWSCCVDKDPESMGCKIQAKKEPPMYHPGQFACFCHDCKAIINGFETSRCAEPCQGNWASKAPNTYSMVHKNWEKDDDQIEFVSLQTLQSLFFKSPWAKRSEGKRNWFEWTCCGSAQRRADGCQLVNIPDLGGPADKEAAEAAYDTTTIHL